MGKEGIFLPPYSLSIEGSGEELINNPYVKKAYIGR